MFRILGNNDVINVLLYYKDKNIFVSTDLSSFVGDLILKNTHKHIFPNGLSVRLKSYSVDKHVRPCVRCVLSNAY